MRTLQIVVPNRDRLARQRVARRTAIRAVAVRLALEHGPDAVTVDMISAAADISPRTFFNHFRIKDDAFSIEPHQWTREEVLGELRSRPEDEPPAASMRAVVQAMAAAADFSGFAAEWELLQELYRRHPELFGRMRMGEVDAAIEALGAEIARRRGTDPATDLYPALLVGAGFAALQAAENHSRHGRRDLAALIDEAFDLLVAGL